MKTEADRCAHVWGDGDKCGLWRDSHRNSRFAPGYAHAFVEAPVPQPPADAAPIGYVPCGLKCGRWTNPSETGLCNACSMDECKTDARPSLAQMESLHGPDWSPAAPPVSGDGDAAGGLVCYSCGNGFADICPLCGRAVCAACAEREGECCCDQPPGDEITEIARKWYTKGTARNAMGPAMYQAVREAYAAGLERGRALGAREALQEAESCARAHRALDADTDLWRGYDAAALEIADALAARRSGGQGK